MGKHEKQPTGCASTMFILGMILIGIILLVAILKGS